MQSGYDPHQGNKLCWPELLVSTQKASTDPRFVYRFSTSFNMSSTNLKAAILVVSQTASEDPSTDKCIPILKEVFANLGNDQWDVDISEIVPDSILHIQKFIRTYADGEAPVNLIITSGGTGFAVKDVTPEVYYLASRAEE
jgi:hypothetical protein